MVFIRINMLTHCAIRVAFVSLLVYVKACSGTRQINTPPQPTWPSLYKTCVEMSSGQEPIRAGWYVDGENKRVRLDSYGIPEGQDKNTNIEILFSPTRRKYKRKLGVTSLANNATIEWKTTGGWTNYPCHLHEAPLYIFIFRYDIGVQYDIFPSPNPPGINCRKENLTGLFPETPLLPNLYFVGVEKRNGTALGHWRASYFLYDIDYLFDNQTGMPVGLFVNGGENVFSYFQEGKLTDDTFQPPDHLQCS